MILALDFGRLNEALDMARAMAGLVGMFKINIHLFTAEGPEAVRKIGALGPGVFLDLKYHDIPNTVAGERFPPRPNSPKFGSSIFMPAAEHR